MEQDSLKRLITAVLSALFLLLHDKLGIVVSDTTVVMIGAIVATFLAQSGFVTAAKAKAAGVAAASGVDSPEAAAVVLGGTKKP